MSGPGIGDGPRWPHRARVVGRGALIGIVAGVPQVLAAQVVGVLVGDRRKADVAPRLVERAAEKAGASLPKSARWLLAMLFHFGYAAWWGAVYAGAREVPAARELPAPLAGGVLGGVIYAIAFSRFGVGTLIGSERQPARRNARDRATHLTSAFSFALTVAWLERRVREAGNGAGHAPSA